MALWSAALHGLLQSGIFFIIIMAWKNSMNSSPFVIWSAKNTMTTDIICLKKMIIIGDKKTFLRAFEKKVVER